MIKIKPILKLQSKILLLGHFDPFCPQTQTASPEVCHTLHTISHARTHTRFVVSLRHTQAQYGNQRETHQSPYLLSARELRERNDRVHLWHSKGTHTHAHTHILFAAVSRSHRDGEWLRCHVLLTRGMIFWYFIHLFSLSALPQGVRERWEGRLTRANIKDSTWATAEGWSPPISLNINVSVFNGLCNLQMA